MDFFASQDQARRNTGLLLFYYVIAVCLIVISVYFAAWFAQTLLVARSTHTSPTTTLPHFWDPEMFIMVSGGVFALVLIGSLYKIALLASGGKVVAEMLGGRPLHSTFQDADEKKLLNVIQEMAIAAGTPVPEVYVLDDEDGINAFAAGYDSGHAVIGVTRGCLQQLSREELQGVIAHEFSHILNGDMRLNIRLIGVLHGILLLGITGYYLMRSTMSGRRRSSSKGSDPTVAIGLFGLFLMIIGYVGVFFGKLIKSAVSRQREYLADASAVQFTRNPGGIAGALKKIGGFSTRSRLSSPNAEEVSHMFFSNGLAESLFRFMATHPPLEERIRRIDPSFSKEQEYLQSSASSSAPASASGLSSSPYAEQTMNLSGASPGAVRYSAQPAEVVSSVGTLTTQHLGYAHDLVSHLPKELREKAEEPYGARSLVYALLLSPDKQVRDNQLNFLSKNCDAPVFKDVLRLASPVSTLGTQFRLPLIDLCLPALKALSKNQYQEFNDCIQALITADKKITVFEYMLTHLMKQHLHPTSPAMKHGPLTYRKLSDALDDIIVLLSAVSYIGAKSQEIAGIAFRSGVAALPIETSHTIITRDQATLQRVDETLFRLAAAAPQIKKSTLLACVACIATDNQVTLEEAELIRAIGSALNCPIPPFLL